MEMEMESYMTDLKNFLKNFFLSKIETDKIDYLCYLKPVDQVKHPVQKFGY